jgi:predicted permease
LYRALLRLYPSDFATEHREELVEVFRDRWKTEHDRGGQFPTGRVWSVLARDLIQTVPAMRGRPMRRPISMHSVLTDLVLAGRAMRRRPVFSFIAIVTLALGIGPTVALFSTLEQLVLDPVAAAGGDRVVQVSFHSEQLGFSFQPRAAHYEAWEDGATSFELLSPFAGTARALTGTGDAKILGVTAVEPSMFQLIGIELLIGRPILEQDAEAGATPVALLTRSLWRERFGGDEGVLGQTIMLDGVAHTVIGVLRETVALSSWANTEILTAAGDVAPLDPVGVLGRLRDGVSMEVAQEELRGIVVEPARADWLPTVRPPWVLAGNHVRSLWIVFAAVCLVLLIAAANVANMLIARGIDRVGELALRTALGASRWRLTRMLLVENLVLAAAGGMLALLVARWVQAGIVGLAPDSLRALNQVSLNGVSVLFGTAMTLAAGIVAGLLPAWRIGRVGPHAHIRSEVRTGQSQSQGRLRQVLVVGEVALALVVFAGAGLMVRSFLALRSTDPGFDPRGLAVMGIHLPEYRYQEEERREAFYRELMAELQALPEVEHVSIATGLPTRFGIMIATPEIEGRAEPIEGLGALGGSTVGPDYFETVGTQVVRGRSFADLAGSVSSPIAVNVSAARQLWPSGDAVGSRIRFGSGSWYSVVAVVEDIRPHGIREGTDRPQFYLYEDTWHDRIVAVAVRHRGAFAPVGDAMLRVAAEIDADVPIQAPAPAQSLLIEAVATERFTTALFSVLAGLSLVLSAVGIYGVVTFAVNSRISELGVRIAIGATATDIMRDVLGNGLRPVGIGVVMGLGLAVTLSRYVEHLVYGIAPSDPFTMLVAACVLIGVAILACVVPARRATRIDPVAAMRVE